MAHGLTAEDLAIEMAKTVRELEARARAKIAALQLGELFYDLQPEESRHARQVNH